MWSGNDGGDDRWRAQRARGPQDERWFEDEERRRRQGPNGWGGDDRADRGRREERDRPVDGWNGRGRGGDVYPGPYDDREASPRRSGRGDTSWMSEGRRGWEGRSEGSWAEDEGAYGPGWEASQRQRPYGSGPFGDTEGRRRRGGMMRSSQSDQADGFRGVDSEDMRWSRMQGLYGGSEYGGYIGNPDSPDRSHSGKGPKGWQRSDDRIRDEVSEALARHPAIDASDIEVEVDGGEVTLRGQVTERRAKRLAEECAEGVFGVDDVQNQLRFRREGATTPQSSRKSGKSGDREVARSSGQEGRSASEAGEGRTTNSPRA